VVALIVAAVIGAGAAVGADVQLISQGRRVDLEPHLVADKLVLFDFFADWCAPCKILEPHLDRIAELHPDTLAIRKVDVINWDSPVARQYQIDVLPHLKLFGPNGDLLAEGDADRVLAALSSRLGGEVSVIPGGSRSRRSLAVWVLVVSVVVATVALARRRRGSGSNHSVVTTMGGTSTAFGGEDPGEPAIWFVLIQGNLEGPFSVEQLDDLRRRKQLDSDAMVRRRGDATWQRLAEVVDDATR
jgi:thiol-disulfide isomerase/thioredoxin